MTARDIVNHPSHYNGHASRVECADLILATNSLLGLAIKHTWRCGEKHDATCPIYVRDLRERLANAMVDGSVSTIIAAAFESNLPCAHCAAIDRRKAAWYLRRLAAWLVDDFCHAVPHGLHATLSMARSIFNTTPPRHPLRVVLQAAWGSACEGFEFEHGHTPDWHRDYSKRCIDAADALESWS